MEILKKWASPRQVTFKCPHPGLKITWWSSAGTLTVKGESELCSKITKMISQLLESKVGKADFQDKSTIEEESTENVVKTRRGRPPNKLSSESQTESLC